MQSIAIVMLFLLKNRKHIYLNKNILVRENTQCVLVHKNKVYDVILPGKYKITKECNNDREECF